MSELPEIPANPALSPGFDKARRLSRLLVVLFTIGFWLGVLFLVGLTIYAACLAFWPALIELVVSASRRPPPPEATAAAMAIVFVAMLPCLAALHYARRLFSSFAVGEIFTVHAIGLMRTTALWLVVAGVVPPRPLVLVIGMAAYVAAYVMAEARRLADESASFV